MDVVLLEYPDKSHNFTNLIFMTSSLLNSIVVVLGAGANWSRVPDLFICQTEDLHKFDGCHCTSIPQRVYLIISEHVCLTVAPLTVELDLYVESFANIAEANMVSHVISIFGYEFTFLVMQASPCTFIYSSFSYGKSLEFSIQGL